MGNVYLDMDGRKMLTYGIFETKQTLRPESKFLLFLRLEPKPHFLGPCIVTGFFWTKQQITKQPMQYQRKLIILWRCYWSREIEKF